ncbi:MAG: hypothetical protein GY769_05230 [bacterium]|nr:hypothetical protein [bacterium]
MRGFVLAAGVVGLLPVAGHCEPHLMPVPEGKAPRIYLLIGGGIPRPPASARPSRAFGKAV